MEGESGEREWREWREREELRRGSSEFLRK